MGNGHDALFADGLPELARLLTLASADDNGGERQFAATIGTNIGKVSTGHTAMAPVVSPDGRTLYVCNRFDNAVSFIDLVSLRETHRVSVVREPVAAAVSPDGARLVVVNHLQAGRADVERVAVALSVIDTVDARLLTNVVLANGASLARGVAISPDGHWACVTHILARFQSPARQVERGWMNANALSFIDLVELRLVDTVLLDDKERGAANPWAVLWSSDGRQIFVTHAGTHEVSVIDAPGLLARLVGKGSTEREGKADPRRDRPASIEYSSRTRLSAAASVDTDAAGDSSVAGGPTYDHSFLDGLRRRIKLPGRGPRALALVGQKLVTADYSSDTLSVIDLSEPELAVSVIRLSPAGIPGKPGNELQVGSGAQKSGPTPGNAAKSAGEDVGHPGQSLAREGEVWFNDATWCFQGWQSCASCHSSDGRVDGLNWDLLNDGVGNPKNSKSLLLAFQTPPAMNQGVRARPEQAVRAGFRHVLFSRPPEAVSLAVDEFLKSLTPVPSPYVVGGRLSDTAIRGQKLFLDERVGCARCHPPGLYTDLKRHEVGTRARFDTVGAFDTPTLVECWRTAPYLHDGSAATMKNVLTERSRHDRHGHTSHLTTGELDDLAAFVLSL
jgi:YVTN family beta-propeller protein